MEAIYAKAGVASDPLFSRHLSNETLKYSQYNSCFFNCCPALGFLKANDVYLHPFTTDMIWTLNCRLFGALFGRLADLS